MPVAPLSRFSILRAIVTRQSDQPVNRCTELPSHPRPSRRSEGTTGNTSPASSRRASLYNHKASRLTAPDDSRGGGGVMGRLARRNSVTLALPEGSSDGHLRNERPRASGLVIFPETLAWAAWEWAVLPMVMEPLTLTLTPTLTLTLTLTPTLTLTLTL